MHPYLTVCLGSVNTNSADPVCEEGVCGRNRAAGDRYRRHVRLDTAESGTNEQAGRGAGRNAVLPQSGPRRWPAAAYPPPPQSAPHCAPLSPGQVPVRWASAARSTPWHAHKRVGHADASQVISRRAQARQRAAKSMRATATTTRMLETRHNHAVGRAHVQGAGWAHAVATTPGVLRSALASGPAAPGSWPPGGDWGRPG